MLLLLACWRPDPWTPPPPPPEAVEAMRPPDAPADEETVDLEAEAEVDAHPDPEPAPEPEVAPGPPERVIEPYRARVIQPMFTLVDEYGQPVTQGRQRDLVVDVRVDGEFRMKVWCEGCEPPAEGWIQAVLLERTPG